MINNVKSEMNVRYLGHVCDHNTRAFILHVFNFLSVQDNHNTHDNVNKKSNNIMTC